MLRLRDEDRCALLHRYAQHDDELIDMRQVAKFVVVQLLRGYKWAISPLFPPACRFVPTCSEYAMEAVERFGVMRGGWMALVRLLRCHPFSRGGYDPVVKGQEAPAADVFRPFGACSCSGADPRLAPWAAFYRRFAAGLRKV